MGSKSKSYGCLLFFVITFFAISGFFWFVSLNLIYGPSDGAAGSLGEALGEIFVTIIFGALGIAVAAIATLIFLILLIIYIVKKVKN